MKYYINGQWGIGAAVKDEESLIQALKDDSLDDNIKNIGEWEIVDEETYNSWVLDLRYEDGRWQ